MEILIYQGYEDIKKSEGMGLPQWSIGQDSSFKSRYDINQIPYDYTVEARNRFKGLDLINRVPDKLWMDVGDIVQETGSKTIPKKRKAKKKDGCLRQPNKQL